MNATPKPEKLRCGCPPAGWPPATVPPAPRPAAPPPPPDHELPPRRYKLRGPQVEPEAAFWTLCTVPCVVRIADLAKRTDNPDDECFFPPYPTHASVVKDEIDELIELASRRDDPEAIASREPGRERKGLSPFLQLRPQPIGAVVNIDRDPVFGAVRAARQPAPDALDVGTGKETNASYPVITTGRELARYFESETPGLAHRLALDSLLRQQNWSPPRQARVWAGLDVAIASALFAAWYYKWGAEVGMPGVAPRAGVAFRPRPWEMDYRVSVLFNRQVNGWGTGDDGRRMLPDPSPGTPRHPAYPSGHSTYSAAASEVLSYFFPDYAEEFDRLADNIGMARLWAGIHWRSDHRAGAKLGRCVGRMVIEQLERSCICPADPCVPPDYCAPPPTVDDLRRCAEETERCCREGNGRPREDRGSGHQGEAPGGGAVSDVDVEAQATGPQEGAAPIPGSADRGPVGPQVGGAPEGASRRSTEQAEGPQEGAR